MKNGKICKKILSRWLYQVKGFKLEKLYFEKSEKVRQAK
jgi:hypothetical protein